MFSELVGEETAYLLATEGVSHCRLFSIGKRKTGIKMRDRRAAVLLVNLLPVVLLLEIHLLTVAPGRIPGRRRGPSAPCCASCPCRTIVDQGEVQREVSGTGVA